MVLGAQEKHKKDLKRQCFIWFNKRLFQEILKVI